MSLGTRLVAAIALVGGLLCAAEALDTEYRTWPTPDGRANHWSCIGVKLQ
jgi:hypothetical protein